MYTEMFTLAGANYRFRTWSFSEQRVTDSVHWASSIAEACELVRTTRRLQTYLYGGCQLERSDGVIAPIGARYLLEHQRELS